MFERISVPLGAVVADANVLLSAVVGKAAQKIFSKHNLEVRASEFNAQEVLEYLPAMGKRYGLPSALLTLRWRLLSLSIHSPSEYAGHFNKASADLKDRDPEDAHALALARALDLPLWSNDRHLAGCGVPCYSTARLLRILETQQK
jgi:predicted nucleic acid-binding protein